MVESYKHHNDIRNNTKSECYSISTFLLGLKSKLKGRKSNTISIGIIIEIAITMKVEVNIIVDQLQQNINITGF